MYVRIIEPQLDKFGSINNNIQKNQSQALVSKDQELKDSQFKQSQFFVKNERGLEDSKDVFSSILTTVQNYCLKANPQKMDVQLPSEADLKLQSIKKRHPLLLLFNQQKWKLSSGHYDYSLIKSLFEIYKCQATHIWFHSCKQPTIIDVISKTKFENLKLINLGNNLLQNIEGLMFIEWQNLESLYLWNNQVTQIRCLKKTNLKQLRVCDINQNYIKQINSITRANLPSCQILNFSSNNLVNASKGLQFSTLIVQTSCKLKLCSRQQIDHFYETKCPKRQKSEEKSRKLHIKNQYIRILVKNNFNFLKYNGSYNLETIIRIEYIQIKHDLYPKLINQFKNSFLNQQSFDLTLYFWF